ncbi:CGNR zinc finger domain-containing protein [Phytohabitans suffuscus]|uniref:Zinc finger CGNR domain-containing protein n=1 Tax=Phytohabitans suffuscus TaxID=624315 RepID=A0A6F8YRV1_9ACTN|nr:CGNR zinc finger domain-containing protein [Phytohabitans suffuscus]BCB88832.1 hypothetical protein Psuf_061450 [Phytohabitans suffuscus]
MDATGWAQRAVTVANADLGTLADLQALLAEWPRLHDSAGLGDLAAFGYAQARLRRVFAAAAAAREVEAVELLNGLLTRFRVQPRIAGTSAADWHMHAAGAGAPASGEYLAGAVWGLAVCLCQRGLDRFGLCKAAGCDRFFLDDSANRNRRFCSDRCATRTHGTAHRARRRHPSTVG